MEIETGRYSNTPVQMRLCRNCDLGEIEDEMHFICNCSKFAPLRIELFNNVSEFVEGFNDFDMKDKFTYLMGSDQVDVLSLL